MISFGAARKQYGSSVVRIFAMVSIPVPQEVPESVDGLFGNKIRVIQAKKGYRVSEDALILAWFVRPRPNELILDAGTGCGVIAFGLAAMEPTVRVVGMEIQENLASRGQRGARLNSLESRVWVVRGDFREANRMFRPGTFDRVVSNPPFHQPGRGRVSTLAEKAVARHQIMLPPTDLFRASASILKPTGGLAAIYPASGVSTLESAMKETGFRLTRMVWIHTKKRSDPALVCIEAGVGRDGTELEEDNLILYEESGTRTRRANAILAGEQIAT